jgi:hypothetical protein
MIPDGTYQLESTQLTVGCSIGVRQTATFMRTGSNSYLAQGVTEASGQTTRTTLTIAATGTMFAQTFLCGNGTNGSWNYTVMTDPTKTTLRTSKPGTVLTYVRVGP